MNRSGHLCRLAAAFLFLGSLSPAFAAPGDLDLGRHEAPAATRLAPIRDYALDTEMVVRDWVLCISETVAEQLVHAREKGVDRALSLYAELNAAKSCGQFTELRVILRERLYATAAGHDARVFGALVDFAGAWGTAYVVYGGLPAR